MLNRLRLSRWLQIARWSSNSSGSCGGRAFTVLALESSADDTCAAVVTSERQILSNVVLKQFDQHEAFGGIEPYTAIREHQKNMPIAVRRALDEAKLRMSQIDGVAFTRGPGMPGCLSVCSNAAKTLASALNLPLIGVHHMQAHTLTSILSSPNEHEIPRFPFLTLLISGGHTLILLALSNSRFRILATTRDEAAGRTIDKVTRELRIVWRGRAPGAALEAFCRDGLPDVNDTDLPCVPPFAIPLRNQLSFSFSGVHSSVDRYILEHGIEDSNNKKKLTNDHRLAVARAVQNAVVAQLEEKIILALKWCAEHRDEIIREVQEQNSLSDLGLPVKHIVVSGGVASNLFFRKRLQSSIEENFKEECLTLVFPPPALCTDNAAMIAWAAMHRFLVGESDEYSIEHKPKWSVEEINS